MACDYPSSSWSQSRGFQWGLGLVVGLAITGFRFDGPPSTPWLTCCVAWSIVLLEKPIFRVGEHFFSYRTTLYVACFLRPSQGQICPIPPLLKHPQIIIDPPPNSTVGSRHCCLYVSLGVCLTISQPGVGESRKLDLSETVQSLSYLANISLALICFSLTNCCFLAFHNFNPASKSLFRTLALFCRSLDIILRLLSDFRMYWWSSRSVESFCPSLLSPVSPAWPSSYELLSLTF